MKRPGSRWATATLVALACTATAGLAAADPDKATVAQAQDHFGRGNVAYNLGKFDEAVDWFTKAYEVWPQSEFLYNIAQAHRQAGHCKAALYFYQRYKSLKEKDRAAPLTKKERDDVERFIAELTECAAKTDNATKTKPDTLTKPEASTSPSSGAAGSSGSAITRQSAGVSRDPALPITATSATSAGDANTSVRAGASTPKPNKPTVATAAADSADRQDQDDSPATSAVHTRYQPTVLSARATAGIAVISAGPVEVPVQPVVAVDVGYPLAMGPLLLELGASASFSPIPYKFDEMGSSRQGTLVGARAQLAVSYGITDRLALRGGLGLGISMLGGLVEGNPFSKTREPGTFTMFSVRSGIAVDYAINPNVVATLAPLCFTFSPADAAMISSSLIELGFSAGIGYRI